MRFGDVMRKIWGGIKTGVKKVGGFIGKALPVVGRFAKGVGNVISYIPGIGGTIGKGIEAAGNLVSDLTEKLPGGKAKDKIKEVTEAFIDKAKRGNEFAKGVTEKIVGYKPVVDQIGTIVENAQQKYPEALKETLL